MFSNPNTASNVPQLVERTIPVDDIKLVFCLVANVEKYREFVPGWIDAKRSELDFDGERLLHTTQQTVGLPGLLFVRKTFWTRTTIEPYSRIAVLAKDGSFRLVWTFEKAEICDGEKIQDGCTVRCRSESTSGSAFIRLLQTTQLDTTIRAFEREALRRLGRGELNSCQSLMAALSV